MAMIQEPFASGNSIIHNIDPRIRVISVIAYSIVIALSNQFPALYAALVFSIMLTVMAQLDVKNVFKRLFTVFWFLVLIWVFLPITFEGPLLYKFGPLHITLSGVVLSARISLKSIAILLAFMALAATMPIAMLGRALAGLNIPGKMIHLLLMTYRYIFVIEQEYKRLYTAIKIRGFRPGTNMHSYKTYAYLIGMLFVRASTRAERVQQAMKLRGFQRRFHTLESFPLSGKNRMFSIMMILIVLDLIILEFNHLWIIVV